MKKFILSLGAFLFISVAGIAQQVIFLDAGHGGDDQGAIAVTGVSEAEINALFVKEMKAYCEAKGIKVIVLNQGNDNVSITDRATFVNNYEVAKGLQPILISIHCNSSKDEKLSGQELYIGRGSNAVASKALATKLQKTLGVKEATQKGLKVLEVNYPAVLIEVGYLSNMQDANSLMNADDRTVIIQKIVAGL